MFESESLRNFVGHTKSHYEGLVKGENQRIVNQALVKHSKRPSSSSYQCAKIWKSYLRHVWMPLALKTQNDSSHLCMELKQKCFADLKSVSKDVMCSYSQSSSYDLDEITEFSMLYLHKSFAKLEKHSISLEIALLECQEQLKNDTVYKEKASNLKKLIEKCKGKSVDTKFDKPSVVRQPNAQRIPKPSVLGKSAPSAQNNVSRPLLRSNQMKDKVVPNTGHVKFKRQDSRRKPNPWILIVQLILFIVDFGCTKHMTGNLSLLCNFMEKYLGTVRFGNDQFVPILGYGDLVQGNITIKRVYYVEGLNHNLFSVGQFCDADLEVAFQKSTCFVRDLQGNNLLTGNRGTDLYTISLQETTSSAPICLIKAKRSSFKSKTVPSSKGRLNLLHMDLCGPMRVASINGKKYILVIVDDYSRYTWTLFLRSKDETPEVLKDFLTMIQRNLQALVISVRTDRGTEFLNKTLNAFFKEEGIEHQTFTPRTPEQNGVVERRNCTLIEAARTMLSASKLPFFL
ncbi:retrovirus-related pol polyprotein from transposon TNT 1-94 [Tanacetum coccineum]|uniref:Retrovirus-related pol polyprotein from transposon TNT 1-94 n=1 Tax=Tanacetum coccineum TaxID=301880 RepID=A0ABQ4YE44_9ASTR